MVQNDLQQLTSDKAVRDNECDDILRKGADKYGDTRYQTSDDTNGSAAEFITESTRDWTCNDGIYYCNKIQQLLMLYL